MLVRLSSSYHVPDFLKNNYSKVNLIHRAVSESLERLAYEYALKIGKDGTRTVPINITISIIEENLDLHVKLTVDEVYYKEKKNA